MNIFFYRTDPSEPIESGVVPITIHPALAGYQQPPPAEPEKPALYVGPFGNSMRNGRYGASLPDGFWELKQSITLNEAFPAEFVLSVHERILVQQNEAWQLFDRDGIQISSGSREDGDITVAADQKRFYTNDHTGFVKAWDLQTGARSYLLFPMFGLGYDRRVLRIDNDRIWIVGTELPVMSHSLTRPPEFTILELHSVDKTIQTDEDGMLLSHQHLQSLMTRPVPMLSASGPQIVLAGGGHVVLLDDSLDVTADLTGEFSAHSLCLDETGRMYMVVSVHTDQEAESMALWGLTPDGQLFLNEPLESVRGNPVGQPVVAYDHSVYAVFSDEIFAFNPTGGLRWRKRLGTSVAGAVISANGQLLVSVDSRVVTLSSDGDIGLVFDTENDALITPPILASPTRIYVASSSTLYHLGPVE